MNLLFVILAAKGIIGDLNWREINSSDPEYQNGLAVGEIENEKKELCNGTHIGSGVVVTANHCCSSSHTFKHAYHCSVKTRNLSSDICWLDCPLPLNYPQAKVGAALTKDIYVLHWNCNYLDDQYCKNKMLYSPGEIKYTSGSFFAHTADTLPGSSGAPVFNMANEIIGVHHSYSDQYKLNYGSLWN